MVLTGAPTLDDVQAAQTRIADRVHRTPLLSSLTLSRQCGVSVLLKAENLQKTGSFKVRGATNAMRRLPAGAHARGVVTISAGNHAQAVAYAASAEAVRCVVVMPEGAVQAKVDATRAWGAEVILHGTPHEAFALFETLQHDQGLVPVHPFDNPDVIAGQGTVGLEIAEEAPDASTVIAPIGGGGLISGVAIALRGLRRPVRLIGVEPEGSTAMHSALAVGHPVQVERLQSIADGLGAPAVSDRTLAIVRQLVDDVVLVTDAQIVEAMRVLLERAKLLTEPAGAAALAALLSGRARARGKTVVVLSGGNVDLARLKAWL
ncbi:MAG: threonine/serine dehydratase [Armatimonadota bacterium]|nr:threonine/serine dehydratase [Armatimonadota bacterium]